MRLSPSQLDYFSTLLSHNPAQALAELQASEAIYADDPTYALYYGAFLIDGGVVLGQANTVERGVQMLRAKVTGAPDAALPTLLYNIANGLTGLYELARQQPGFRFDPDDQTLEPVKDLMSISGKLRGCQALASPTPPTSATKNGPSSCRT